MSRILVKPAAIEKKANLGQGFYRLMIGPFPGVGNIRAGQFVHIKIPDTNIYFRRAFSIYDIDSKNDTFDIIFKVFGRGTKLLGELHKGDQLDILGPLGNKFKLPSKKESIILVAGGIGMPPMYLLAKQLIERGFDPDKINYFYGGNTKEDLVDITRIKKTGINLITATLNGTHGYKGLVTDAIIEKIDLDKKYLRMYACGPEGMLKAVDQMGRDYNIPGQVSLEAPMPCGFGVCLGCILPLRSGGYTRVCKEGPVYDFGEVIL